MYLYYYQECDRKFTNEKNLAHHMKHHHNAEKPEKPKEKKQRKRKKDTSNNTEDDKEAASDKKDTKPDKKLHPCHLCTVGHFFQKTFQFLIFKLCCF